MLNDTLGQALGLHWFVLIVVLSVLYLVYKLVYNLFFHPLRHYPGPWSRAATRIPYAISIFNGTGTFEVELLHENYGSVVRIAPDTLSYITSEAWQDIYSNKSSDGRGNLQKDPHAYLKYGVAELSTAGDADHRRLRRLQSHAFSEKALMLQRPSLEQCTEKFISCLRERAQNESGVVDFTNWLNCLTTDIIGDMAFSVNFGGLDDGKLQPSLQTIFAALKHFAFIKEILRLPWALALPAKGLLAASQLGRRNRVVDFGTQMATERQKVNPDRPDFVSYMTAQDSAGRPGMTQKEVERAAITFIVAGSETTATLLSGAIYLLLSNKGTLERLTTSVRNDFESTKAFTYSRLQSHEYLNAVLQETLRLYPPAPDQLYRSSMAESVIVAGKVVPPNTSLTINFWAANRSAENFHRHKEFLPERWLRDAPAEFRYDNRAVLKPFSVGPRDCLGKSMAWIEMRMILAHLVYAFDLVELQDSSEGWIDRQKIFFLWEKMPLHVKIRPRQTAG